MSAFFQTQQQVAALDPRLGGLMVSAGLYNLRALIKGVRACKTLADERALLQKESASIRTSFKDDDVYSRHNNLSKLLYIHMLGYPAHFGQMECLKLVASPRYTDKRLGYLGIMLLLDENAQVLMLVTNGLKNDMNHSNMYIVGLALCTFANIASEEMSRDLCNEIEKLMASSNSYIRKKAALCARRIATKVPDLIEDIAPRAVQLLGDKSHGVQICALSLAIEICRISPERVLEFRRATPALCTTLKTLLSTSFSPEHDVAGVTDPFLQAKILRFLRVLGAESERVSEAVNDILAQVATNTDASKNVGNSILYECVETILAIRADSALRVMAINILGKFLGNLDNNIRYVALNTLNKVVSIDTNAVQRHRGTVISCLRDADISIRRRALVLAYALINEGNVHTMVPELLSFLEVADAEFKPGLTTQLSIAAERFAPSKRWHIDTILHVLRLAGNYIRDEVLAAFLRLVCHTPELQEYTVQRLYAALRSDMSQRSQTLAAVWVIGEFGEVLLGAGPFDDHSSRLEVSPRAVVDLLVSCLDSPYADDVVRQFVLTALAKLHVRFDDNAQQMRIAHVFAQYNECVETELQKRAVEYGVLVRRPSVSSGVLETMPLPEIRQTLMGTVSETKPVGSTNAEKDALLEAGAAAGAAGAAAPPGGQQSTQDLLADIFGGGAGAAPAPAQPPASHDAILSLFGSEGPAPAQPAQQGVASATSGMRDLDLLGGGDAVPSHAAPASQDLFAAEEMQAPSLPSPPAHEAYNRHGLRISLRKHVDQAHPDTAQLTAHFAATAGVPASGVSLQAAVPKTQKLQMQAISGTTVVPGQEQTQVMRITGAQGPIRLRLRIAFTIGDTAELVRDQTDWTEPTA